jgi:hypothetical protein
MSERGIGVAYQVRYNNGRVVSGLESYRDAIAEVVSTYDGADIGHSGDLTDGGERTLCWASEEDAVNDDGARAVASIYAVQS